MLLKKQEHILMLMWIETLRNPETPRAHTHTRYGYSFLSKPRNPQPLIYLYKYILGD